MHSHQSKEDAALPFEVAAKMMEVITPEEAQFLADYYNKKGKEAVAEKIAKVGEIEEDSMSPEEFKFRTILDKIITKGTFALGALGTIAAIPAPFVALGLGIAAVAGYALRDAAWWSRKGHDYEEESFRSRGDWYYD